MKFSQFRNTTNTPLHSSGYAKVANGDSMGVVSSQSFRQRQHIEKNRRVIGQYGASAIAQSLGNHLQNELRRRLEFPRAQGDNPDHTKMTYGRYASSRTSDGTRGTINSSTPGKSGSPKLQVPERRTSFREPPTRGYNPYR